MQGIVLFLATFAVYNVDSSEERFYYKDIPSSLGDSAKLDVGDSLNPGKTLTKDLAHVAFQAETKGRLVCHIVSREMKKKLSSH